MQCAQNKSVLFCLNLENRAHLDKKEYKTMNWLPTHESVNQRICACAYNIFINASPLYMSDIFFSTKAIQNTRKLENIESTLKKTNIWQYGLPWNSLSIEKKLSQKQEHFKIYNEIGIL